MVVFSILTESAAILAVIAFSLILHRVIRTWSLRKIHGPPSDSLITGNLLQWYGHWSMPFREMATSRYGSVFKLNGFLGENVLCLSDTKALYQVLIKRQDVFEQSEYFIEGARIVIGSGLLGVQGDAHRKQRRLMNPAFTIGHMKRMIPVFQALTLQVQDLMTKDLGVETKEIDMLDYLGRLAVELIAQAGLGHSFGAIEGKDDGYSLAIKSLVPSGAKLQSWRTKLPYLTHYFPARLLRLAAELSPFTPVHEVMDISDIMDRSSRAIWEKKKSLYSQGDKRVVNEHGEGRDIMSILLKANIEADEKWRLSDAELLGQISTFMIAGSDTTSTALSRILYLLSLHPETQEKLREELTLAGCAKGELGHDELNALPLLEAVCRETLRLHPPVHFVQRDARKDFVLPLGQPFTDTKGELRTDLFVPRGTTVYVNILGVNRDPAIFGADALHWKPQRWLSPLPQSVTDAHIPGVYGNTLTFIGGGRSCIGFKFSLLEMKVALSQLVAAFRFEPPEKQEIVWRVGGIMTPSVKGSTTNKPELPLRVSVVH